MELENPDEEGEPCWPRTFPGLWPGSAKPRLVAISLSFYKTPAGCGADNRCKLQETHSSPSIVEDGTEKVRSLKDFSAQTGFHALLWLAKVLRCALYFFQGLTFQSPLNDIRLSMPRGSGKHSKKKAHLQAARQDRRLQNPALRLAPQALSDHSLGDPGRKVGSCSSLESFRPEISLEAFCDAGELGHSLGDGEEKQMLSPCVGETQDKTLSYP